MKVQGPDQFIQLNCKGKMFSFDIEKYQHEAHWNRKLSIIPEIHNNYSKGTVSLGNKLFLNSTHLLDIIFCANKCSKVFKLKKSKIHIRRHFPGIDMRWRPLARVCLWLHVSSCRHSTRRRYIVSINMASIKA